MRIKITKNPLGIVFADGSTHIMNVGSICDVHENQGIYWCGLGDAELVKSDTPLSPAPPVLVRTNMEVGSDAVEMVVAAMVKSATKSAAKEKAHEKN